MHEQILEVEKLIWRGRSLARLPSGKVVILSPGAFPGEIVRAEVSQEKKDHLQARVLEVLQPLARRRPHPCPRSNYCGGCTFGVLPQGLQLEHKLDLVRDTLRRHLPSSCRHLAELDCQVYPSRPAWRYRWRGRIQVRQGLPYLQGLQGSGLIYSPDCLLYASALGRCLQEMAAGLPDGGHTLAASPKDQQIKAAGSEGRIQLPFSGYGFDLELPPGGFFQANWGLNQTLVDLVCSRLQWADRVGDMYSGAGNFSLPLALQGRQVLALDGDAGAIAAGRQNASRLGLENVRFQRLDLRSRKFLGQLSDFRPQALILDPPRSGAGKALQGLRQLSSLQSMLWVSCDLVNTCRDLAYFLGSGWELKEMVLLDMFPQTWHLEMLFRLQREA
ncbi:MAG: class I SAM-dependent RNA methyltransferase [Desulfohalobiaceae bacterium]